MKIALIGYGKMGKEIEQIAVGRGHTVILKIDIDNQEDLTKENLSKADVAIEFTTPATAVRNYRTCFEAGVPVISGTTGWLDQKPLIELECLKSGGCFFYASNFSLGVNLFFELNRKLARMMMPFPQYDVSMTEIHHTQKLDAPSGTAITLAEGILDESDTKKSWTIETPNNKEELHIQPVRKDPFPGLHTVKYDSEVDYIEITHNAYNRKGFAQGVVSAAEFCLGKKGIFNMSDLLKL
ncbi:MAG TPA: 4-hydroxy-tetrahydrodipicolinate reductase [Prolixibacteraceae bacterium]|nr:4-hydroxy-tetrahydrodipicolinate reductase [Prolixibacteraceae bacterium]